MDRVGRRSMVKTILILIILFSANSFADECEMKKDQLDSLYFTEAVPLPVVLFIDPIWNSNGYRGHKTAIMKAVDEWNKFGKDKLKTPIFEVITKLDKGVPDVSELDYKLKYAETQPWLWLQPGRSDVSKEPVHPGLGGGATGYTTLERTAGRKGTLKLGFVMVWTGQPTPEDITKTTLHELGHGLGLDHSCKENVDYDPKADTTYAGCDKLPWTHDYAKSILHPDHNSSSIASLQKNDKIRAFCSLTGKRPVINP